MSNEPRILICDIETSPMVTYTFGLRNQNIGLNQLVEPTRVLCVGYQWLGDNKATVISEWNEGREAMLEQTWTLLDEADYVVGYNSASFDCKILNGEFATLGFFPPSPYEHIDLLKIVRKQFRYNSAKLDHVLDRLSLQRKLDTSGFGLWRDCMAGDSNARRRMSRYCAGDVAATKELYLELRPWDDSSKINFGLFEEGTRCPRCGSEDLTPEDTPFRTKVNQYEAHRCNDCGYVAKSRLRDKSIPAPDLT